MIRTRVCNLFGIDVPIFNAPMASAAGGELAAAVSAAGGFGFIGAMGHDAGWLRAQIKLVRERTDKPFGVGFISHRLPQFPELFTTAIDEGVPVIAHSFADPAPYMPAAKRAGVKVIAQVQSVAGALEAARAGVDALVAQGAEAGGHTGSVSILSLVPDVAAAVSSLPVIAAGGIASGETLAAAFMLGAEGGWLGTAFLASPESMYSTSKKVRVLQAGSEDTVLTRVFDLARGEAWPDHILARAANNAFIEKWHGREDQIRMDRQEAGVELAEGMTADDVSTAPVWAGTGVGEVLDEASASVVVRRIAAQAEYILVERTRALVVMV